MPQYDFKCPDCEMTRYDMIMPITKFKRPMCSNCGEEMVTQITRPPMVHWKDYNFAPISLPTIPGAPVVSSHKERRELMKKHDMVETEGAPPTHEEQKATHAEVMKSIDAISVPDDIAREMDIIP